MVSRKDVAERAGVSPASVSYYINSNGYVSQEKAERIQKAIDELNYRPNQIARSLKVKDSRQLVFLCNEIRNPFYSQLIYRATKAASREGYVVMFSNVVDDAYVDRLCSYQISGVFASSSKIRRERINSIAAQGIPVVLLKDIEWEEVEPTVTQISIDYSNIMTEVLNHLSNNGYRRIHYISGSRSGEYGEKDEKTKSFLAASGVTEEEAVSYGITDSTGAYQHVIEHYDRRNCPDAFVCTNDAVALGVMNGVNRIGLKVPDIGVIGFDNTRDAEFWSPRLTSVDIQTENMGDMITALLLRKLRGEAVEDVLVPARLVIRDSSVRQ